MITMPVAWTVPSDGGPWERFVGNVRRLRRRTVATFWKIADQRIPAHWLLLFLGIAALLAYLLVLFFGPHPGK